MGEIRVITATGKATNPSNLNTFYHMHYIAYIIKKPQSKTLFSDINKIKVLGMSKMWF